MSKAFNHVTLKKWKKWKTLVYQLQHSNGSKAVSQRYQAVCINSASFNKLPVASGFPQRTVVRELLFSIYVNDLPNVRQIAQPSAKCVAPSFYCTLQ